VSTFQIWRIEGLSKRYIFFNDDFMVARPTTIRDWVTEEGQIITRFEMYPLKGSTTDAKRLAKAHKNQWMAKEFFNRGMLEHYLGWSPREGRGKFFYLKVSLLGLKLDSK
jgi:hypothetical protein